MTAPATTIEWRPICGSHYSVSSDGQVKNTRTGRILKPFSRGGSGHVAVQLPTGRRYVHHLVLEAFVGPRPEGVECCHSNGNPADNRIENLRWDTRSANVKDAVRHGVGLGAANAAKTHCPQGHEYSDGNTYIDPKGSRRCRACKRRWN